VLGVEISGVLLLAGIVGAYHLGKQRKKVIHRFLKKETAETDESENIKNS
jgi:NADH-quinone oxidoreductase subunit J